MPRKGQEKQRQREECGDFVLDGIPILTQHARERMQQRNVTHRAVIRNPTAAGVVANEATGTIVTVIPRTFVQQQRDAYRQRRAMAIEKNTTTRSTMSHGAALQFIETAGKRKQDTPDKREAHDSNAKVGRAKKFS